MPLDATETQPWLYRQGGLVLGPLSQAQLVEKLFSGELDGKTPVAHPGEQRFVPISEISSLAVQLAKAEAKLRVDAAGRQVEQADRRRLFMKVSVIVVIALVVAGGAATAAHYLAIHPLHHEDALAFADIQVDPPTITVAHAHRNDTLIAYDPLGPAPREHGSHHATRPAHRRHTAGAARSPATPGREAPDQPSVSHVDYSKIQEVVAARQRSLYPCLIQEAKRHPGLSARIPIEFTVGNAGHVVKLWVDNPDYKKGKLYDCLFTTLKKWPFPSYSGERANVQLAFTIGHHKQG